MCQRSEKTHDARWTTMRPLLVDSCASLFSDRGVQVDVVEAPAAEVAAGAAGVALVEIESDELAGSVGIAAPAAVLARTHPLAEHGPLASEDIQDWALELCNQLAGRFKNRLLPYGIVLRVSPPRSGPWTDAAPGPGSAEDAVVVEFLCGGQHFHVQLAGRLADGVELREEAGQETGLREGDLLLF